MSLLGDDGRFAYVFKVSGLVACETQDKFTVPFEVSVIASTGEDAERGGKMAVENQIREGRFMGVRRVSILSIQRGARLSYVYFNGEKEGEEQ